MTNSLGSFKVSPTRNEAATFDFTFWRSSDIGDTFTFKAYPTSDPLQVARITRLANSKNAKDAMRLMDALIASVRRMLADDDGTPADWFPTTAPTAEELGSAEDDVDWPSASTGDLIPAEDGPAGDGEDDSRFIAPNGEFLPWSETNRFDAFEAGSSLRRWRTLWSDDNEYMVPVEQLLQAWQALTGAAGKGRTAK